MAGYTFYSENKGEGNNLGTISSSPNQSFDLKDYGAPIQNDEARSVVLQNVPMDAVLIVSDDPNGSMSDDWCVIVALQDIDSYTVGTFEQSYSDQSVRVTYFPHNGLDGKISHISIA